MSTRRARKQIRWKPEMNENTWEAYDFLGRSQLRFWSDSEPCQPAWRGWPLVQMRCINCASCEAIWARRLHAARMFCVAVA
ncbi:hypothetical protein TRAPUB_4401 [Trametes pubescens]|uniref:Uncharacterized protein n=1 Tax=Trametes pubescens TaxID=154538 RepID=A0A1M2VB77_TRAPU|nr:hypothetical protein TRAPUB_4401 [Trametes pubescens]